MAIGTVVNLVWLCTHLHLGEAGGDPRLDVKVRKYNNKHDNLLEQALLMIRRQDLNAVRANPQHVQRVAKVMVDTRSARTSFKDGAGRVHRVHHMGKGPFLYWSF